MKRVLLLLFLFPAAFFSQELEATVSVNYEQLPTSAKEVLEDFRISVEDYLNKNKFTGGAWEGEPIKCNFNVFFSSSSDDINYTAQVVVNSQRPIFNTQKSTLMLNIMDNNWNFYYEKNRPLYFNETEFDPLTSFLDFYAYLIIGFDLDSFEPNGGTAFFDEAYQIALLGSAGAMSEGWELKTGSYNKRGLIENLLNEKYQQFRQDYFNYHYNGVDLFHEKKKFAQENIAQLVLNLWDMNKKINLRSVLLNVFFDAKSAEIIDYLKDYPDRTIFEKLKKIDPSHISKYNEMLNQRDY